MNELSIELGHIYQDMELDKNYLFNLKKSKKIIEEFSNKDATLKLLIDDLNIKEKKWTEKELIDFLNINKIDVDVIVYESKFTKISDLFIESLDKEKLKIESFKKENKKCLFYINNNKKIMLKTIYNDNKVKYSCVLLSTLWQLCRLGYYEYPQKSYLLLKNKKLTANKTITVIDKKYEIIENKVIELLKIKVDIDKIQHKFI